MNSANVRAIREALGATPWLEGTRRFGRSLRQAGHIRGGLLIVGGTDEEDPWHLTAHLAEEARYSGLPELEPTLVRWRPPPGAPAHLAVGLDRLEAARHGETVLVVAPAMTAPDLLQRVSDARRDGAIVLALQDGDPELAALAHDVLDLEDARHAPPATRAMLPPIDFDLASHLVSLAAGESAPPASPVSRRLLHVFGRSDRAT